MAFNLICLTLLLCCIVILIVLRMTPRHHPLLWMTIAIIGLIHHLSVGLSMIDQLDAFSVGVWSVDNSVLKWYGLVYCSGMFAFMCVGYICAVLEIPGCMLVYKHMIFAVHEIMQLGSHSRSSRSNDCYLSWCPISLISTVCKFCNTNDLQLRSCWIASYRVLACALWFTVTSYRHELRVLSCTDVIAYMSVLGCLL